MNKKELVHNWRKRMMREANHQPSPFKEHHDQGEYFINIFLPAVGEKDKAIALRKEEEKLVRERYW